MRNRVELHGHEQFHIGSNDGVDQFRSGLLETFRLFHLCSSTWITCPRPPSTWIHCPSLRVLVPFIVPITAGMPYSRATIAAWEADPPVSTTTAAARWNRGVQAGLVTGATRTSPVRSFP